MASDRKCNIGEWLPIGYQTLLCTYAHGGHVLILWDSFGLVLVLSGQQYDCLECRYWLLVYVELVAWDGGGYNEILQGVL